LLCFGCLNAVTFFWTRHFSGQGIRVLVMAQDVFLAITSNVFLDQTCLEDKISYFNQS